MKKRNIALNVTLLLCGLFVIALAVQVRYLSEENRLIYERMTTYEQKALDWQTKAEATEIKLAEAEGNLQNCSERMEELETLIFESEQIVAGLESEIESLETIVSNYNESGEQDSDYTNEDKTILAATMYAENYFKGE